MSSNDDLADRVAVLSAALAAAGARTEQLAERLALLEQLSDDPAAGPAGPPRTAGYRHRTLADWVDTVFARLAAGHRAKWCTNWAAHPEARIRLEVLWHTWEAAAAAPPGGDPDWAALDDWVRVRLDHHAGVLLAADGPFGGCIPARGADPGRCCAPPRLAQRPLAVVHPEAVAELHAARAARSAALAGGLR